MKKTSLVLLLAGVLTACVTINIYFPAAAAQEAADEIIDDVWQIDGGAEKPTDAAASDSETTEAK